MSNEKVTSGTSKVQKAISSLLAASTVLASLSASVAAIATSFDTTLQKGWHFTTLVKDGQEITRITRIFKILKDVSMSKKSYLLNVDLSRTEAALAAICMNLRELIAVLEEADLSNLALLMDMREQAEISLSTIQPLRGSLPERSTPELNKAIVVLGTTVNDLEKQGSAAAKRLQTHLDGLRKEINSGNARFP